MKRILYTLFLILFVSWAAAQSVEVPNLIVGQIVVNGVVTSSEDGLPLPQLNIHIKGTTTGVVTGTDGRYSITVPSPETILVFEYVGMETQEILVGHSLELNVVMSPALEEIDQVMVMGYTQRGKNQLTGSSVQLDSKELNQRATLQVVEGISGKIPSLVTNMSSSTPGSLQTVRVRGAGSIAGDADPLYVVDGVPIAYEKENRGLTTSTLSSLAALNNADIESVTLLKDASATAAYGARGSNGVIVIKTKSGRKGKTKFNATARYGIAQRLPNLGFMTPEQQLEALAEAYRNSAFIRTVQQDPTDPGFYFNYATGTLTPAQEQKAKQIWSSLPDLETYKQDLLTNKNGNSEHIQAWDKAGRPNNDYAREYWRRLTQTTDMQFSASGGTDIQTFYASMGANYSQNPVVGADFKRFNGSLNVDRTLVSWLQYATNNQVSYTRQDGVFSEDIPTMGNPIAGPYYASPFVPPYKNGKPNRDLGNALNWLYLKDHDKGIQSIAHLATNNALTADITEGLKFKTRFALDYIGFDSKEYNNRIHSDQAFMGGRAAQSKVSTYNLVTQNSLTYDFSLLDQHKFSLMALQEYQRSYEDYLSAQAYNTATDKVTDLGALSSRKTNDGYKSSWANAAYLLLLNYDFASRYILDLSYRLEGSSRFPRNKRFGNFGSVGAAWNIHSESFFAPLASVFNRLRFRASWGVSGNSEIGNNRYRRTLEYFSSYNGTPAGDILEYGNPDLTWEKNATLDLGFEFGLWYNRISGSFTFFNKNTYDLLQPVPMSLTTGHESRYQNAGEMYNRGFEVQLDFALLRAEAYNLNLGFNMATLTNRITKLSHDPQTGKVIPLEDNYTRTDEGHALNEWYLYPFAGIDPTTGATLYYTDETRTKTTKLQSNSKRIWTGYSATPTLTAGMSLHADWKAIYLEANAIFMGGHKIMNSYLADFYSDDAKHLISGRGVDGMYGKTWKYMGDTKAELPIVSANNPQGGLNQQSDIFLRKGDFIRLRDITLGYNFPKKVLQKMHFGGAINIYAQVTNLFTYKFDKRLNYDPEVPANGMWEFRNPAMRTYSIGCNINF